MSHNNDEARTIGTLLLFLVLLLGLPACVSCDSLEKISRSLQVIEQIQAKNYNDGKCSK